MFLRDHRIVYIEVINNWRCQELEYFIWGNDIVISNLRKTENIFIDATFHTPIGFNQTLIIMFKDIITGEKYPGIFILMNKKSYILYKLFFESILSILKQNNLYDLNFNSITTDAEPGLIKFIKEYFPDFVCLYHFKKDIVDQAKFQGLMKKEYKNETKKVISKLTNLAID